MIALGIDPGASGGIALVGVTEEPQVVPMPKTERDIWEQIQLWSRSAQFAVIEKVSSAPGQGVASSFKFGTSYGFLTACLVASGIPFEKVSPGKWQKEMGCIVPGRKGIKESATAKKNRNKQRAQELFPQIKMTHAIADALMIAEYCRRVFRP